MTTNINNAQNEIFAELVEYVDALDVLGGDSLSDKISADDLVDIADIDELTDILTYRENPFDTEFIYYSDAWNYLKENDGTLSESLELAAEYGYSLGDINVCILATIHAEQENRDTWYENRDEINELLERFADAANEEEDDEEEERSTMK